MKLKSSFTQLQLIALLLIGIFPATGFALESVAHRGFSSKFKDNTIEAIEGAWEVGVELVEVDVRLTSDDIIILFHDAEILETKIGSLTYNKIQSLTPNYHVPTLEQAIDVRKQNKKLLLDLKDKNRKLIKSLIQLVREQPDHETLFIYQSRRVKDLKRIQDELNSPTTLFVSSLEKSFWLKKNPNPEKLSEWLVKNRISGISAKGRQFVDKKFVRTFQDKGLIFYIWTINPLDRIEHYESLNVDGIITDYPSLLLNTNDVTSTP